MSRIRELKPRVEPPKDRPVQWFYPGEGQTCIGFLGDTPACPTHWCEAATLTKPSGPVHSLEAQDLPAPNETIEVCIGDAWFRGFQNRHGDWHVLTPTRSEKVLNPSAWRPLPDDEPGDAELLEAAREVIAEVETFNSHLHALRKLADIVRKRTEGGK